MAALHIGIKDTEYVEANRKLHLSYIVELDMEHNAVYLNEKWNQQVSRRYSEFRRLHKKLTEAQRFYNVEHLPKLPSWIRLLHLFTRKMTQKEVEERRIQLEEYLIKLSATKIVTETPYFAEFLKISDAQLNLWIKEREHKTRDTNEQTYTSDSEYEDLPQKDTTQTKNATMLIVESKDEEGSVLPKVDLSRIPFEESNMNLTSVGGGDENVVESDEDDGDENSVGNLRECLGEKRINQTDLSHIVKKYKQSTRTEAFLQSYFNKINR